ncbi:putative colanic acid biosynthesis acetyltransferase [Methylomonas sp. WSC-6]|uniref:Colanic acid biosynthesis acetyltransferase n=1 Tax=Methylomonas rivi TaxID=2952226 RepID=A0ABT1U4E3_9GAMM|nr:putative colanic acid biosynthesis acetyltransferase [Methylomonas sp. WSC-6]MCQ8128665.1 putative colanic acid biosynthesis acetyltransferase [Methylomonas sp. WSC-6]
MAKQRIYVDSLTKKLRFVRFAWYLVYTLFYCWTPRILFWKWRVLILRLFGAKIGSGCKIDPSCFIWAPWNLEIGDLTCIANKVELYSVDKIKIGSNVTVSQRSFICTASHDITLLSKPLTHAPIEIADHAWVCAESFLAPGVKVGEGAVIGARSAVFKDVEAWSVVGGNPAKFIKKRILRDGN